MGNLTERVESFFGLFLARVDALEKLDLPRMVDGMAGNTEHEVEALGVRELGLDATSAEVPLCCWCYSWIASFVEKRLSRILVPQKQLLRTVLLGKPPGAELTFKFPGLAVGIKSFADPMK